MKPFLEMGAITRPHGLTGLVRFMVFADNPRVLDGVAAVRLVLADGREVDDVIARLTWSTKGQGLLLLQGCADRDAAERLRGARLYVHRDQLPPLEPDEFYLADTVGCAAFALDGAAIGRVASVGHNGAQPLLVLRDGARQFAVPAVPDFIVEFDGQRLVLNLPEGLISAVEEAPRRGDPGA